jgi:hypothetical protein
LRGRSNTGFTYPDEGSIEVNLQTTLNQITINHDVGMSPVFRASALIIPEPRCSDCAIDI